LSGIKHLAGPMIHDGEGLALGKESLNDILLEKAGADELERYFTLQRRFLLGKPNLSHAAFAKFAH
jgi:hypothetical protein